MAKFQRVYTLTVQGRSGKVYTFTDPLTLVFDTQSRLTSGINTGHFMLYNLDPITRFDLEFDSALDIDSAGALVRRPLVFNAGYVTEGFEPLCFQGDVFRAFSYREDTGDVVTDFEVKDGGLAIQKAQVQSSRAYPWNAKDEVTRLVSTMAPYGVSLGAVGSLFDGYTPQRGVMHLGATWDNLKKLAGAAGGGVYINQTKVYVMSPNDVLTPAATLAQLDATTGLLDTPIRSGWTVTAKMIFEPRLQLGQQLRIKSQVTPSLNGTYAVWAIGHRGIISGAKDGGCVTNVELFQSSSPFFTVGLQ